MARQTRKLIVDRCQVCERQHFLMVRFTQLATPMQWTTEDTMHVPIAYCCPVAAKAANFSADFEGVVEDVGLVSVTLSESAETVFQYGSNCSAERLNSPERLDGVAIPMGAAKTVEDYELQFDLWSLNNNCACADIVKTQGKTVWGVLYEIPSDFVRRGRKDKKKTLEEIEGQKYRPIRIRLRDSCGMEQEATTFVGRQQDRQSGIKTSLAYVRYIVSGLRDHAVCDKYIQEVKRIAVQNNPDIRECVAAL